MGLCACPASDQLDELSEGCALSLEGLREEGRWVLAHLSDCYSQDSPFPASWLHMSDSILREQADQGSQTLKLWGQTENISK